VEIQIQIQITYSLLSNVYLMFHELLVIVDLEIAADVSTFQCITVFLLYYV